MGIRNVPDPTPEEYGVVIRVKAIGLCLSDWYGRIGHDPDITLPYVPGHELAGLIEAVGDSVIKWKAAKDIAWTHMSNWSNKC